VMGNSNMLPEKLDEETARAPRPRRLTPPRR